MSHPITPLFGLLALILLLSGGFGVTFAMLGIICSVFGLIRDKGSGRKTALYGFLSSFVTLLLLGVIMTAGYLSITGRI